jgi:hypothetical protein
VTAQGAERFPRLALKWAAAVSDFAATLVDGSRVATSFPLSVVPASLRGTSAVAEDLADAWGPCLDAATRALFAREEMGADAEEARVPYRAARAFALLASALAEAQLRGSLELVFADDANGPDAPLAKPLNPSAKRRDERGANGPTPLVGSDVADARSGSAFAVKRGRPSDARAALAARCLARVANWTFRRFETNIVETEKMENDIKDITLRRSVVSACASAARALDAGVDSETERAAEDGKSHRLKSHREKFRGENFRGVSFAAEARALGSALAAHAAHADAAAAAVAIAAGLARRPGFACAARAAEIVAAISARTDAGADGAVGGADALRASERKNTKIVTPLLLLTAVRTLLESESESVTVKVKKNVSSERAEKAATRLPPFAFAFASLAASADATTASVAKRALFGDATTATLEFGSDDAIAALAASSAFECAASSRNDTDTMTAFAEDGVPVALRALAAFFSDAAAPRRAAPRETAAFAALREGIRAISEEQKEQNSSPLATFLRALGPACASATLRRARLCAAPNRAHAARRADVVAAAEGLKFWAAATNALALESDDDAAVVARQTATVATFLPLALEAIAPTRIVVMRDGSDGGGDSRTACLESEEEAGGEDERAALAAAATRLVASLAGTAPAAFRAAVAALRPESTARLRAAMGGRDKTKLPSVGARAQGEPHQSRASTPPPPSFAAFENA